VIRLRTKHIPVLGKEDKREVTVFVSVSACVLVAILSYLSWELSTPVAMQKPFPEDWAI